MAARNHNKIQSALQDVSWKCKPRPTHSVRKILNSVLCQQSPDDEGHPVCGRSLLNSRPITKASDDLEALTPYHNLHISKKIIVACKTKRDLYIRMRWRKVRCVVTSVGSCVSSDRHARQSIMVQSQRKPHSWGTRHHYRCWSSRSSWMMSIVLEAKEDAKGPVCTFCSQTKHSILERPVTLVCLLVETTGYYWTGEWECCAVRYSVMLPTKKSQVRETWWRKHTWSMSLGMVLSCRSVPCSTIAAVGTRSGGSCSQTEPPLYVVLCPDWELGAPGDCCVVCTDNKGVLDSETVLGKQAREAQQYSVTRPHWSRTWSLSPTESSLMRWFTSAFTRTLRTPWVQVGTGKRGRLDISQHNPLQDWTILLDHPPLEIQVVLWNKVGQS